MRRIIVNADDFGWDQDTFASTVDLIERGWVTSATIMTGLSFTSEAINYAVDMQKHVSFGLHFNMVDGHASLAANHRSLVDRSGRFWASDRQRIAALFSRVDAADIARELRAQLKILADAGITISHVDSHGHLHKFPSVARAMASVLAEFGIAKMRRPQNLYARRALSDMIDGYCSRGFPKHLKTTDYYFAIDQRSPHWLEQLPAVIPQGVTEISVHPGQIDPSRRFEFHSFDAQEPADLKALGVTLMNYNDLQ